MKLSTCTECYSKVSEFSDNFNFNVVVNKLSGAKLGYVHVVKDEDFSFGDIYGKSFCFAVLLKNC
jgi:hypothetical protein